MKKYFSIFILAASLLCINSVHAQTPEEEDKMILGYAKIVGGDTLPMFWLENVEVLAKGDPAAQSYWRRLRYNVYKVYPYAQTVQKLLQEMDRDLAGANKSTRKKYLNKKEAELKERYKKELKDLSVNQGKILVKLIYRNTGRDSYSIIKEMKGGLSARISQIGMGFFDGNLKAKYDPNGEDKDIEVIVQEIESRGLFR